MSVVNMKNNEGDKMEDKILEKAQDIKQDYAIIRHMFEMSNERLINREIMQEIYKEWDWENQLKKCAKIYNIEYNEYDEEIIEYGIIPYLESALLNYLGDIINDCISEMLIRFPDNELLK